MAKKRHVTWRSLYVTDRHLLSRSPLFDAEWYRAQNPEAPADKRKVVDHFLQSGAADGFDPHPLFSTAWYREEYAPELADGRNPLADYLREGAFAGRNPNPWFDSAWYLSRHPELAARSINPLEDYVGGGWRAGRDPHPKLDVRWYLAANDDVAQAGYDPLTHYLVSGQAEGRLTCPPERRRVSLHPLRRVRTANPRLIQPDFNSRPEVLPAGSWHSIAGIPISRTTRRSSNSPAP